jgi:excisionase family DNA binding protein
MPKKREPSPIPPREILRHSVPRLSLSVLEAAEATGLSKSTLYNLMGDGTLPFTKIRGRRVLAVASLESLISPTQGPEVV